MAGTKKGGEAAAKTNQERYGSDFYAKIGAKGGKKGRSRSGSRRSWWSDQPTR